ncbi:MAG: dihydropteroate synthase [Actinobacteria bacterium]|nr:dihydropteroate synthase [Actinomycetota bacterium]
MFVIAEKVNVITTSIKDAMKNKDKKPIQDMVELQLEGKPDCIDINLGPATKNGPEMMQWMVRIIEEVTDLPLSLDTMNMEAMEAGLQVVKNQAIINSISSVPERMEKLIPMAVKYEAKAIGLCTSEAGVPRDENERLENGYNLMMAFAEAGISIEDYWIDPIVLPICVAQDQVHALLKATKMFSELPEKPHMVCGLSNVSNNSAREVQGLLNRLYLAVLMGYGMDAAILDPNDKELMAVARGESSEYELALIGEGLKDGELDLSDPKQLAVHKTLKLFHEQTLYADSYLEL